ncbi:MAG: TolC family protein [Fibrobacteres bacterium]|nr:TolC family protein [Fibrobacterota bacterium]
MSPRSIFLAALLAACLCYPTRADDILGLDQAIRQAVERNFGLSVSRDQREAATVAREGGVGQFLPSADANASLSGKVSGGSPTTTLGASATWILFDGLQNVNGYRRLKAQEQAATLQERLDLENLLETVIVSYYDVVQLKQQLQAIEQQLAASSDRARLAQAKLEVGSGSKLEQLQSLSDLNQDSSTWLDRTLALQSAKVRLNQELARDPAMNFEVADSIPLDPGLPLEDWQKGLPDRNASVAYARAQQSAAQAGLSQAQGRWFPTLSAGLNYSTTPDALNSSSVLNAPGGTGREGATYGVNLSLPLFDRLSTPTAVRQARLDVRSGATRAAHAESQAAADFEVARRQYALAMTRIGLETRNLQVAKLQAEAAQARYRLGASSPLEFRDAQTRLLDAQGRLITARQSAKQAETALRRLAGSLVSAAGQPAGAGDRK